MTHPRPLPRTVEVCTLDVAKLLLQLYLDDRGHDIRRRRFKRAQVADWEIRCRRCDRAGFILRLSRGRFLLHGAAMEFECKGSE